MTYFIFCSEHIFGLKKCLNSFECLGNVEFWYVENIAIFAHYNLYLELKFNGFKRISTVKIIYSCFSYYLKSTVLAMT